MMIISSFITARRVETVLVFFLLPSFLSLLLVECSVGDNGSNIAVFGNPRKVADLSSLLTAIDVYTKCKNNNGSGCSSRCRSAIPSWTYHQQRKQGQEQLILPHPRHLPLHSIRGGAKPKDLTPPLKNSAILFIKPHANTPQVQNLVTSSLSSLGITVRSSLEIKGEEMDKKGFIDQHYYAIANRATLKEPKDMNVPKEKFEEFFGESWEKVLSQKRAANAMVACKTYFSSDSNAIAQAWREAEQMNKVVKFGGGFYCGLLTIPSSFKSTNSPTSVYVFNAFYMSLRSKFVEQDCSIQLYEVEWDSNQLSWKDFREKVLGVTDPSIARKGSLRRLIYQRYKKLGLESIPTKGDNGVHGSASPFEGLAEKVNWLNQSFSKDEFGKALLSKGVPKKVLKHWCTDPRVMLSKGDNGNVEEGSLFDAVEDLDANECFERLVEINAMK